MNSKTELLKKAPWLDFDGNEIHEGDTIQHPSGESGIVVFLADEEEPKDQWRVDYGDSALSRLCLQIGDKGMAVVFSNVESELAKPEQISTRPANYKSGFDDGYAEAVHTAETAKPEQKPIGYVNPDHIDNLEGNF